MRCNTLTEEINLVAKECHSSKSKAEFDGYVNKIGEVAIERHGYKEKIRNIRKFVPGIFLPPSTENEIIETIPHE